MRLVGPDGGPNWDNRGHFFAASAEAMRRILVENARRKSRQKHGGGRNRVELEKCDVSMTAKPHEVLAVNDAVDRLAEEDELAAEIVKLRYFAGLSVEEAGNALELSGPTPTGTGSLLVRGCNVTCRTRWAGRIRE